MTEQEYKQISVECDGRCGDRLAVSASKHLSYTWTCDACLAKRKQPDRDVERYEDLRIRKYPPKLGDDGERATMRIGHNEKDQTVSLVIGDPTKPVKDGDRPGVCVSFSPERARRIAAELIQSAAEIEAAARRKRNAWSPGA